jgi:multiple sugar transport system substrate-binding protein
VTLDVACPNQELADLVQRYSPSWRSREKVEAVNIHLYEKDQGPESGKGANVWLIPASELPRYADAGKLLPIPPTYLERGAAYNWSSLLPVYREHLLAWGWSAPNQRAVYGFPILGEAPLCFYRAQQSQSDQLAGDQAQQEAFRKRYGRELTPPRTWKEYEEIAEFFARHAQPGEVHASLASLPEEDDALVQLFFMIAADYSRRAVGLNDPIQTDQLNEVFAFHFDLRTGEPRLAAPEFVHALQLLQRLQKYRGASFREGRAVLTIREASALSQFQAKTSPVRDRVGITAVPAGEGYYDARGAFVPRVNQLPYLGANAWVGVVPVGAANPEAAFSLLADLSTKETSSEIVFEPRWGGGVIRITHLEQRSRWDAFDLDSTRTDRLKEVLRDTLHQYGVKNPAYCLRTPDAHAYVKALAPLLRRAIVEGRDARQTLDQVSRLWSNQIEARGTDRHRRDVYISLGLEPE